MVSKIRTSNKADWVLESITVIAHHCPLTEIDRYLDMKRMLIVPLLAVASMATAQDEPPVDLYPRVQVQTTVGSFVVELDDTEASMRLILQLREGYLEKLSDPERELEASEVIPARWIGLWRAILVVILIVIGLRFLRFF